jgi:hypothetical protein
LSSAYGGISPRGIEPIVPKENRSFDRFRRLWYPFSWRDLHRRYNADSVRRRLISNKDGLVSHAETTIGPFPKLPELDPEEVKAVRSFLPGKLLGRTAAFLSLVLLVVGFVSLADIGLRQLLGAELPIPLWLYWTLLIGLPFMAVVTQVIVEFRAERNRLLLQKLALRTGVEQSGYFRIGPYLNTAEDRAKFSRADRAQDKVLDWIERSAFYPSLSYWRFGIG